MTQSNEEPVQAPAEPRKTWEPLGFEKIDAAEIEASFTGSGVDSAVYS